MITRNARRRDNPLRNFEIPTAKSAKRLPGQQLDRAQAAIMRAKKEWR
jgi:hypothetical protein